MIIKRTTILRRCELPLHLHCSPQCRGSSLGQRKKGGTEFPRLIALFCLQHAAEQRKSAAVCFGHLRRAYYTGLVELVLGPLLTEGERQTVLAILHFDELRKQVLAADIAAGRCRFEELKLPTDLLAAIREWLRLPWFMVQGCPDYLVHNIGVKPGDPAADVLFAFVFHCFHALLLTRLREAGLAEFVLQRGRGIIPDATPPVQCPLGAPPFMYDLCTPLSDDCPVKLLERVTEVARALDSTAAEFGFMIKSGPGKTEAVFAVRGKGKQAALATLAKDTEGEGLERTPLLPIFRAKSSA